MSNGHFLKGISRPSPSPDALFVRPPRQKKEAGGGSRPSWWEAPFAASASDGSSVVPEVQGPSEVGASASRAPASRGRAASSAPRTFEGRVGGVSYGHGGFEVLLLRECYRLGGRRRRQQSEKGAELGRGKTGRANGAQQLDQVGHCRGARRCRHHQTQHLWGAQMGAVMTTLHQSLARPSRTASTQARPTKAKAVLPVAPFSTDRSRWAHPESEPRCRRPVRRPWSRRTLRTPEPAHRSLVSKVPCLSSHRSSAKQRACS